MKRFEIVAVLFTLLSILPIVRFVTGFGNNFWKLRQVIEKHREYSYHKHYMKQSGLPINVDASLAFSDLYLTQPYDHFDLQIKQTYKQRYWVNRNYWTSKDGPVFLYIGGEGALSSHVVESGAYVNFAKRYGALIFAVEHRFYGKSINPDGMSTENLKYLSSQQALADLASFHKYVTNIYHLTEKNKWIAFGGSYPGALTAWIRIKYPHLIHASVASSAPVRALLNFELYNDVVANSLASTVVGGSAKCLSLVREAFKTVDDMIQKGALGQLEKDFISCSSIASDHDVYTFVSNLADPFMGIVQYNNEKPGLNISNVCALFTQNTRDAYSSLMELNKMTLKTTNQSCADNSWTNFIGQLKNVSLVSEGVGMRQWTYQTCAQFGYYQTCDVKTSCPFSHYMNLTPNLEICQQLFGISTDLLQAQIDFTNEYYGSDQPHGSNILFVNGLIDPWHALSVLHNLTNNELALVIDGTAHCADMHPDAPTDLPALRNAREIISNQIGRWLSIDKVQPKFTVVGSDSLDSYPRRL